jgi:hypothetical protein
MADDRKSHAGILILAGIGAGVIAGAVIGIALSKRNQGTGAEAITETVDDLRDKAERVLHELSDSISELKETTQRITADIAGSIEIPVESARE